MDGVTIPPVAFVPRCGKSSRGRLRVTVSFVIITPNINDGHLNSSIQVPHAYTISDFECDRALRTDASVASKIAGTLPVLRSQNILNLAVQLGQVFQISPCIGSPMCTFKGEIFALILTCILDDMSRQIQRCEYPTGVCNMVRYISDAGLTHLAKPYFTEPSQYLSVESRRSC